MPVETINLSLRPISTTNLEFAGLKRVTQKHTFQYRKLFRIEFECGQHLA